MLILHLTNTSGVRNTPARIACYWGRYTEHRGKSFNLKRGTFGPGWHGRDFVNPYGAYYLKGASNVKKILREHIDQADVLHFHDDVYLQEIASAAGYSENQLKDKIIIYHAHIGNVQRRFFVRRAYSRQIRHAVITNGYGRFFDNDRIKWGRLPDILDLNHPTYRYEPKSQSSDGRLKCLYTYSNKSEGIKINAKRPESHTQLLKRIPGVKSKIIGGVWPHTDLPFEEAMAEKKKTNIVVEELFTPYLHLSALEGAAVGAMVVTRFDDYTKQDLCSAVGSPEDEWPFYYANEKNIRQVLMTLAKDRETVDKWGKKAFEWMRKYYRPEILLRKYLEFYGVAKESAN